MLYTIDSTIIDIFIYVLHFSDHFSDSYSLLTFTALIAKNANQLFTNRFENSQEKIDDIVPFSITVWPSINDQYY